MLNNYDTIAPTKIVVQDSIGENDIAERINYLVERGILKIKKSPEIGLLHRKIACFRGKFLSAGGGT